MKWYTVWRRLRSKALKTIVKTSNERRVLNRIVIKYMYKLECYYFSISELPEGKQ